MYTCIFTNVLNMSMKAEFNLRCTLYHKGLDNTTFIIIIFLKIQFNIL